jgi:hypothetical protein
MKKHQKAMELLQAEIHKLAGAVVARWLADQNEEAKKTVEAAEFMQQLFEGKLKDEDKEYLKPYLEPLYEVNASLKFLMKDAGVEDDRTKK